ncbi:MAG: hypothetical protein DRP87_12370 [Spirochaetes bacterium]|nr:MAG: hypothetical protein DRP87_12370 [Spirochaetota bacterium]
MKAKNLSHHIDNAIEGMTHGGTVKYRILLNEDTCGSKSFSLLVNTMKGGETCREEDTQGHKHDVEHGFYCLSGRGYVSIGGEKYSFTPGTAVFVPSGQMHYVVNEGQEDLDYIVLYVPAGEEKKL